ncbi:hypothetical protein MUNTM_37490 [Mycobacterium sp. MUNTM1]
MACAVTDAASTPSSPATGATPIARSDSGPMGLRIWVVVISDTPVEQKCRCLLKAGLVRMFACRGVTRRRIADNAVCATQGFAPSSDTRYRRALVDAPSVI